MTVVAGMIFNRNQGAIIADKLGSTPQRTYDLISKIHQIHKPIPVSIANAGNGNQNSEATSTILEYLKNENPAQITPSKIGGALRELVSDKKRDTFKAQLYSRFGLTEDEMIAGTTTEGVKINDRLMQEYIQILNSQSVSINNPDYQFLIMTDNGKIDLHSIKGHDNNIAKISRPYEVIGYEDAADLSLKNFFESMPQEERVYLDAKKGLVALANALNTSSNTNPGVGSLPDVNFHDNGKIYSLTEDSSRLYSELAKLNSLNILRDDFTQGLVKDMFYDKLNFEDAHKEFKNELKATNKEDKAELILRGYKR